jgi:signal transduction histidine kinase
MRKSPRDFRAPSRRERQDPPGEEIGSAGEPLDLLRYFTGSALAVVLVSTVVLASASAWLVHRSILRIERDEADSLAEDIVSDLGAAGYGRDLWGSGTVPEAAREETLRQMDNFGITEFTLFSPDGRQIEEFVRRSESARLFWREGFEGARSGETVLRWERGYAGRVPWIRGPARGDIESYVPVRDRGSIVAVARVRRNQSPNLVSAEGVLPLLIGLVLAAGLAVFLALWLLVLRADRILRRQHREILEAQIELARQNRLLAELSRRKDEFYAMCSHDIRTPLVSVEAGCRLLLGDGGLEDQRREILVENLLNTGVVLDLLSNLLDLARIDEGEDLDSACLDLRGIAEAVAAANRPLAACRGISLEVEVPSGGVVVNGDRLKLVRILNNLVSNAIKHADGKPVTVVVAQVPGGARIEVRDQGPGLRPEICADLMGGRDPAPARAREESEDSHGLGLSIVRRLVDLHGGKLEVRSESGAGTTFVVTLPVAA